MGFGERCLRDREDDMIRTVLDSDHPFIKGITLEELDRDRSVRLRVAKNGDAFLPFAEGGFATAPAQSDLGLPASPPPLEPRFGSGNLAAKYPLDLISPTTDT